MSAAAQAPVTAGRVQRRRVFRHAVAVPVDLTVLRSGVPDSIPGRTVDVGENGLAAVIAGELHAGDLVGLEFRLPTVGARLRAKAVVRHQEQLHCGLEFLGLSLEQRAMLRYWTERTDQSPVATDQLPDANQTRPTSETNPRETKTSEPRRLVTLRRLLLLALAAFAIIGCLGWWQWYRAWQELESRVPDTEVTAAQPAQVPAEVMEQLVTHKVEPQYPASARQANLQGTVLLDTLIGQDGTVVKVKPVSGPEALASAAMEAVRWWRFQPYQLNGQPAEVETTVAVEFRP